MRDALLFVDLAKAQCLCLCKCMCVCVCVRVRACIRIMLNYLSLQALTPMTIKC